MAALKTRLGSGRVLTGSATSPRLVGSRAYQWADGPYANESRRATLPALGAHVSAWALRGKPFTAPRGDRRRLAGPLAIGRHRRGRKPLRRAAQQGRARRRTTPEPPTSTSPDTAIVIRESPVDQGRTALGASRTGRSAHTYPRRDRPPRSHRGRRGSTKTLLTALATGRETHHRTLAGKGSGPGGLRPSGDPGHWRGERPATQHSLAGDPRARLIFQATPRRRPRTRSNRRCCAVVPPHTRQVLIG